jgi:hypothetical protein
MIIFSLIKTNYSRNNGLFKNNSTQSKGNRIVKMGKLFLTNSLKSLGIKNPEFSKRKFGIIHAFIIMTCLNQKTNRVFQFSFQFLQKYCARCAIHNAVVARKRDFHHIPHNDFAIFDNWFLHN